MPRFSFPLSPHPAHGPGPLLLVTAAGSLNEGCLELTFGMRGRIAEVELPPYAGDPCRRDGLWTKSCCEIFIGLDDGYLELNFSPSRDWAAYRFEGYRRGQTALDGIEVDVAPWKRSGDELQLHSRARWSANFRPLCRAWRINACAVVEDNGGQKSYWALRHPSADPDFHHSESFLTLDRSPEA